MFTIKKMAKRKYDRAGHEEVCACVYACASEGDGTFKF